MVDNNLDLLEKRIKNKEIGEYEIYYIKSKIYETQFIQAKIDSEREVRKINYFIRILNQKEDGTGIGIINGNSLNNRQIDMNIDKCQSLSKLNISSKYKFPEKQSYNQVNTAEIDVLKNPLNIKEKYCKIILSDINSLEKIIPTFGRFRVHIQEIYLKNSNKLNLKADKTFFFFEFALKAKKNDKLAEYWDVEYIKNSSNLHLEKKIRKWSKNTNDTLKAKLPIPKKEAIVLFSPSLLKDALNPVLSFHVSGQAYHDKISKFELEQKVADESININDNGLLEGGLKSNNWDGEGNPHQKTELINNGIFKKRIFDQKYATLENTISTGNGMRSSEGSIVNSISNLEIKPGTMTLDDMISNIKEGYFIEKCSWLNPDKLSGSFGAEIRNGYYIKDGELKYPIKGGNISGNVLQMLNNCECISKKCHFSENSYFPYILFSNLNISA